MQRHRRSAVCRRRPTATASHPAWGATTSADGTGVYERLVLANNQNAVVLKMYGPRPPADDCNWSVNATLRDVDGPRYTVTRACYGEDTIANSLARGDALVPCDGLRVNYQDTGEFYRFTVPRTCLTALANKIKVTKSVMDVGSPSVSEAGPTVYVLRG